MIIKAPAENGVLGTLPEQLALLLFHWSASRYLKYTIDMGGGNVPRMSYLEIGGNMMFGWNPWQLIYRLSAWGRPVFAGRICFFFRGRYRHRSGIFFELSPDYLDGTIQVLAADRFSPQLTRLPILEIIDLSSTSLVGTILEFNSQVTFKALLFGSSVKLQEQIPSSGCYHANKFRIAPHCRFGNIAGTISIHVLDDQIV